MNDIAGNLALLNAADQLDAAADNPAEAIRGPMAFISWRRYPKGPGASVTEENPSLMLEHAGRESSFIEIIAIDARHQMLPLDDLVKLYPCPFYKMAGER